MFDQRTGAKPRHWHRLLASRHREVGAAAVFGLA